MLLSKLVQALFFVCKCIYSLNGTSITTVYDDGNILEYIYKHVIIMCIYLIKLCIYIHVYTGNISVVYTYLGDIKAQGAGCSIIRKYEYRYEMFRFCRVLIDHALML